ncbi:DUF1801 domain-containing protein [Nocardioides marmotae]|uniref:DUF1801 domain-containing protein n=1 Tax=Nocardioides marmotae TaxID=2663857 RepID=A0A6I3JAT6_9ACTN|nr:DUF1801 domain-containing protein [Nocardioides marmotae]MCR6031581.1 DUF1801 domain-containing protein [Gordonia jinghuaiqii]MBC9733260.1 DUF1801 domain-containing protein [Nocardioides marmotae]MTB84371.1 DUF1801 domain-containing protein [Nocardioides marmotae]MTB95220.1 DUF1801 domain-containing protein [Nocardioides marmotae]QKE02304.1 DUF1801 domain-containing protein [Nocardioides marmotae]
MSSKDEKNLSQVVDKIAGMDEPRRSVVQRVHEVVMAAAPDLKPRIWYGMPAYALSASTPALVTLRNDERLNLAITEKAAFRAAGGADGQLMPAAWYFETVDDATEARIAEIVRSVVD